MLCLGGVEDLVLTGNLKPLDILEGGVGVVVVVQMDEDGIVLYQHILVGGALIKDTLEAVVAVQGRKGQTLSHLLLLGRMNLTVLIGINEVVDADHTAVGDDLRGLELLFAQQSATDGVDIVVVFVRGNLYEVEGNLTQSELSSPLFNQQFHTL